MPQGSPLSSILFIASVNKVLKQLKEKGYRIVAFADDWVLVCKQGLADAAINDARSTFGGIGLTLNEDKCEILSRDGAIEFLG